MTYVIAEPCVDVKDKACVDVCPVDCIKGTDDDRMLYIDPDECIDCGACVPVCPVEAIFEEGELPAKWALYTELNAQYFKDQAATRSKVKELVKQG
ncbi:MAG: ferredoxin family protein [Chloroflexi bacterium]|nr:ferredoxin family protein [Chloroflexota bacterium]